jgi:hypothetical protein
VATGPPGAAKSLPAESVLLTETRRRFVRLAADLSDALQRSTLDLRSRGAQPVPSGDGVREVLLPTPPCFKVYPTTAQFVVPTESTKFVAKCVTSA